jgi:predicted ribosomally synthesized peptide with SipW-like signal peptide
MKFRILSTLLIVAMCAVSAPAQTFGVHAGYYGNEIKEAFVGGDLLIPLGPLALMPNIDYTRSHGVGYWWFSGDVTLRMQTSGGGAWWLGAGPTYAYFTDYDKEYPGEESTYKKWGWDATAGLGWKFAGFSPYLTGRYMKVEDEKTVGAAVGLRF